MGAELSVCGMSTSLPSHSSAITSAIAKLKEVGINFLALDFDQTVLDIHTGGHWRDSLEDLYPHVRPVFAQLLQAAVEDGDLHIAIVTFSRQISIVRGILDHIVGTEASQHIPIRGADRSWEYRGKGSMRGKQPFMASAVQEIESTKGGVQISKATTLLIDDDSNNIRSALKDGTRAIWFNPDKPHLLLQDILRLE
eukprot:Nitzschia sp. Nitz4//scaffold1_size375055//159883//160470//NITZ4_000264-RA/size375055-processed-gene-0.355-mRNA-1//1//CDS//3329541009//5376//frame0